MYIYYFKNKKGFEQHIVKGPANGFLLGKDLEGYSVISENFENAIFSVKFPDHYAENIFKQIKGSELEPFFEKATMLELPNFPTKRTYGKYVLGKAEATLITRNSSSDELFIETSCIDGLMDMKLIREMLWGGKILPRVSYERVQRRENPVNIFRQFLAERKLSIGKKLFFVWRLIWS